MLKKCESVGGKLNLQFTSKNLAGKNKVELTFQGGQGIVKFAVTIQQVSEKTTDVLDILDKNLGGL